MKTYGYIYRPAPHTSSGYTHDRIHLTEYYSYRVERRISELRK